MLPNRVVLLACMLSFSLVPLGVATPHGPATGGDDASFQFESNVYRVELTWPEASRSLVEGATVFEGTIQHGNRTATIEQRLNVDSIHVLGQRVLGERFLVTAEETTNDAGEPVLTLHVSLTPVDPGTATLEGVVKLTFQERMVLHEYGFHRPSPVNVVGFAGTTHATTTVTWDRAYGTNGSLHPNGTVVHDDGRSLDPYGAGAFPGAYGVFQQDPGEDLVGHARVGEVETVNSMRSGSLRISPGGSEVTTVFGAPSTNLSQDPRAVDALVFQVEDPTTDAYLRAIQEAANGTRKDSSFGPWFDPSSVDEPTPEGPVPHVLVGIPDTGINPYHEIYHRPNLTVHPSTYIPGFPESVPALNLSVGEHDTWQEAYEADREVWDAMEPNAWYWIPETVFVAVMCERGLIDEVEAEEDKCLIDDTSMHGTGTTSSVLTENPNALIAFKEGNAGTTVLDNGTLPVDIISYSWGSAAPLALPGFDTRPRDYTPFLVAASGNEGAFPVVLDSSKASHAVINVGAADAATRTEPGYSGWKTMDFVSQYCRPTAQTESVHGYRESSCGTSFAAPTVAGALSKVILEVRRDSGYTGSVVDGVVDPVAGVTKADVREALNRTATYTPDAKFPPQPGLVPLVEEAPWYQWGWGYVDSTVVDGALACLQEDVCPERAPATEAYMEALWAFRDVYGGWTAFDAYKCLYGSEDACQRLPGPVRSEFSG